MGNISNKIRHGINERIVCIQYLSWKHKSQEAKAYLQVNFLILLGEKKIEDFTGNLTRIASVQFKKSEIICNFSLNFKISHLQVYSNHKYQKITPSQNVYSMKLCCVHVLWSKHASSNVYLEHKQTGN